MKKILLLLPVILIMSCKSKSVSEKPKDITTEKTEVKFLKLENSSIPEMQKNKAYELGKRILMTCNTSKFKPFNENEATPSVIKNMTQERLTKTCLKFKLRYGDFKDIELVSVYKIKSDNTTLFRYKALYEKKIANKELRVSLNENNQISAIQSLDWSDTFEYK
jgi:hypothetical protein